MLKLIAIKQPTFWFNTKTQTDFKSAKYNNTLLLLKSIEVELVATNLQQMDSNHKLLLISSFFVLYSSVSF